MVSSTLHEPVREPNLAEFAVYDLYSVEELEALLLPLKEQTISTGWLDSVQEYFAARVRVNVHVCLALDHSSTSFAKRCETNPVLLSR
jgi:hypothetical protein